MQAAEVLPGGFVGRGLALGGLGEVGLEVLPGAGELGGEVLVEDGVGGLEVRAEVVGNGGAGALEDGVEIGPAGGGGVEDGEQAVGGDAGGIDGEGLLGFGFGEVEIVGGGGGGVEIGVAEADVGVVAVGAGGEGLFPEGEDGRAAVDGVFVVGGEGGFEVGGAGGVDGDEAVGELLGFGVVSADEGGCVPVELGGVFDGVGVVGVELEGVFDLFAEAAGGGELLEGAGVVAHELGAEGVGELGVGGGAVGGEGDGFFCEGEAEVFVVEGPLDLGGFDEGVDVGGVLLEVGLDEGESAEVVALIEEGVGGVLLGGLGWLWMLGGGGGGAEAGYEADDEAGKEAGAAAGGRQECGAGGVLRDHVFLRGWALLRWRAGGRGAVPEEIVARREESGVAGLLDCGHANAQGWSGVVRFGPEWFGPGWFGERLCGDGEAGHGRGGFITAGAGGSTGVVSGWDGDCVHGVACGCGGRQEHQRVVDGGLGWAE